MQTYLTDVEVNEAAIAAWALPGSDAFCAGELPFVELALPEYAAAGLGKAFCRAKNFQCRESGERGYFARSICADTSRLFVINAHMQPIVLGASHEELQAGAPADWLRALYDLGMPVELVSLAAQRARQFQSLDPLVDFVRMYHERASWLEAHPLDVAIVNLESESGATITFDGSRLFCGEERV